MKTETSSVILERILAAHSHAPDGCIAFDGDGTLWSGDIGEDLLHALVEDDAIRAPAAGALRAVARANGVDAQGTASEIARRMFEAYEADRFPEPLLCEVIAWLSAGRTEEEAAIYARAVLDRDHPTSWKGRVAAAEPPRAPEPRGFERRLHREAHRLFEAVRERQIDVFIVSASPRAIVNEAAARLGLDPGQVVAMTPRMEDRRIAPYVERPTPYGEGKVAALAARTGGRPLLAAFGDNAFDIPLLAAARVPVAVRPKDRLRARAGDVPALVEVAAHK